MLPGTLWNWIRTSAFLSFNAATKCKLKIVSQSTTSRKTIILIQQLCYAKLWAEIHRWSLPDHILNEHNSARAIIAQ